MADPIIRARNGDTSYFKRTPVEVWSKALDDAEGDSVLACSIASEHIHCSKVIYGKCPELLHQPSKVNKYTVLQNAAWHQSKPSLLKFVISVGDTKLHRMQDLVGNTALHHSILYHKFVAARLLIEADRDHLSYVDDLGKTPLSYALRLSYGKTDQHDSVKMRRLILEKEPDASKIRTGEHGWTALHQATSEGDVIAIEDIIRFCPDSVHMVDNEGSDFLDIAAASNHSELVRNVLQVTEIWDSILKGNNIEGIKKLASFISDGAKESDWFAKRVEATATIEAKIATKQEVFQIKCQELQSLNDELGQLTTELEELQSLYQSKRQEHQSKRQELQSLSNELAQLKDKKNAIAEKNGGILNWQWSMLDLLN